MSAIPGGGIFKAAKGLRYAKNILDVEAKEQDKNRIAELKKKELENKPAEAPTQG